mmetsp:Transcript_12060/g.26849  ORF Transcript_12060/g.26849 Transcript_12060/m.26849 type:complete len:1405 (+) Transcript_12060:20-4234(+)
MFRDLRYVRLFPTVDGSVESQPQPAVAQAEQSRESEDEAQSFELSAEQVKDDSEAGGGTETENVDQQEEREEDDDDAVEEHEQVDPEQDDDQGDVGDVEASPAPSGCVPGPGDAASGTENSQEEILASKWSQTSLLFTRDSTTSLKPWEPADVEVAPPPVPPVVNVRSSSSLQQFVPAAEEWSHERVAQLRDAGSKTISEAPENLQPMLQSLIAALQWLVHRNDEPDQMVSRVAAELQKSAREKKEWKLKCAQAEAEVRALKAHRRRVGLQPPAEPDPVALAEDNAALQAKLDAVRAEALQDHAEEISALAQVLGEAKMETDQRTARCEALEAELRAATQELKTVSLERDAMTASKASQPDLLREVAALRKQAVTSTERRESVAMLSEDYRKQCIVMLTKEIKSREALEVALHHQQQSTRAYSKLQQEFRNEKVALQKHIQELTSKLSSAQRTVTDLQDRVRATEQEAWTASKRLQQQERDMEEARSTADKAKQEYHRVQGSSESRVEALQKELSRLKSTSAKASLKLKQEREEEQRRLTSTSSKVVALEQESEALTSELMVAQQAIEEVTAGRTQFETTVSELEAAMLAREERTKILTEERDELEGARNAAEARAHESEVRASELHAAVSAKEAAFSQARSLWEEATRQPAGEDARSRGDGLGTDRKVESLEAGKRDLGFATQLELKKMLRTKQDIEAERDFLKAERADFVTRLSDICAAHRRLWRDARNGRQSARGTPSHASRPPPVTTPRSPSPSAGDDLYVALQRVGQELQTFTEELTSEAGSARRGNNASKAMLQQTKDQHEKRLAEERNAHNQILIHTERQKKAITQALADKLEQSEAVAADKDKALEAARAAARRYKAELTSLERQRTNALEETDTLVAKFDRETSELNAQLAQAKTEYDEHEQSTEAMRERLAEETKAMQEVQNERLQTSSELTDYMQQLVLMKEQKQQRGEEIAQLRRDLVDAEMEKAKKEEECRTLTEQLRSQSDEVSSLTARVRDLESLTVSATRPMEDSPSPTQARSVRRHAVHEQDPINPETSNGPAPRQSSTTAADGRQTQSQHSEATQPDRRPSNHSLMLSGVYELARNSTRSLQSVPSGDLRHHRPEEEAVHLSRSDSVSAHDNVGEVVGLPCTLAALQGSVGDTQRSATSSPFPAVVLEGASSHPLNGSQSHTSPAQSPRTSEPSGSPPRAYRTTLSARGAGPDEGSDRGRPPALSLRTRVGRSTDESRAPPGVQQWGSPPGQVRAAGSDCSVGQSENPSGAFSWSGATDAPNNHVSIPAGSARSEPTAQSTNAGLDQGHVRTASMQAASPQSPLQSSRQLSPAASSRGGSVSARQMSPSRLSSFGMGHQGSVRQASPRPGTGGTGGDRQTNGSSQMRVAPVVQEGIVRPTEAARCV